jgi:hypothetical protein
MATRQRAATTLALLTSPKTGPDKTPFPPPLRRTGLSIQLIASRYSRWKRKTTWDFAGEVIAPCALRDRAKHYANLHAANRKRGGRSSPERGGENGLRPERGSSSTGTANTQTREATRAGLFETIHY